MTIHLHPVRHEDDDCPPDAGPHCIAAGVLLVRRRRIRCRLQMFDASSWNGENSGREYKADAVVRADGKAFHVGADGCQLDFAIHGAQMEVEQRGQCGTVLGHGSDVDFQGTYIDEEHAPNKGFEFE
ncbi:hypothetical protein [Burkholderia cepacia]|uniref:hypothetical protein n=2 Tax=Burkholderia cepacia TaxID=292 RepID=UPI001FC8B9F4|nr:hypothetical protein [Burkholderia cepacia]